MRITMATKRTWSLADCSCKMKRAIHVDRKSMATSPDTGILDHSHALPGAVKPLVCGGWQDEAGNYGDWWWTDGEWSGTKREDDEEEEGDGTTGNVTMK